MSYQIIQQGESLSFPDAHPFVDAASGKGEGVVLIGAEAGQALQGLEQAAGRPFIAIELDTECLGAHTGEDEGPANVVGFARFRLGDDAPTTLVELVKKPYTDPQAVKAARAAFEAAGLVVAECNDFPGRILNRLVRPYYNAALRRLDEGLATAADMDKTLCLGLGYPEGPISLLKRTGLHHHYRVTQAMYEALGQEPYATGPQGAGCLGAAHQGRDMTQPLNGIKVLDFSTLLPGPMCTLILAEAGADVVKLERAAGDEMRSYAPRFGDDSVNFVLLNRGKRSVCMDLKAETDRAQVLALVKDADVVVEQFRPGVMKRLGLDYETLSQINPRLIYCSITTYGQYGPKALRASHDLNFQAETGMLALSADASGAPVVPPTLTGDLAAGTYPAVINILLALRQRDMDGKGQHLDISMTDNLFTLMYWGLGNGLSNGQWPRPGNELVTGGSVRYAIYKTSDGRYLSAAPLEDRFWNTFLTLIGAPALAGEQDEGIVRAEVTRIIASQTASYWVQCFEGHDVCVSEIINLEQAVQDPHFKARGVFEREVANSDGQTLTALPVPVCASFRSAQTRVAAPALGEHTDEILGSTIGDKQK